MVFPLGNRTYTNDDAVKLPEYEGFWNDDILSPVYSGIRFGSDGKIYRATAAGNYQWTGESWLISGAASGYYLVRSITSGASLETDGGTLQQMNSNNDYRISTTLIRKTTDIEFSIASDSTGATILKTRTYRLDAGRDYDPDQGDDFLRPNWKRSQPR
jgi:hypothetical protein